MFIALGARTPHSRPLRAVQHPELESRGISDQSHHSTECVNLPDNLSFRDSAYRRVAGHTGETRKVSIDQQNRRAKIGGGSGSLATGVSPTDNNHIV